MYESARCFIFVAIFISITSDPQIVHLLVPPLYERLKFCILLKLCFTFPKRLLKIRDLMAVF